MSAGRCGRRGRRFGAGAAALALLGCARSLCAGPTGLLTDVTFTGYPERASAPQVLARLLPPLAAGVLERTLAVRHETLTAHDVDLAREHFVLYVPAHTPPAGYGLLVFIPPWPEARLPPGWDSALERFGVIFVSAAGSGNEASDLTRRVPLALIAAADVAARFPVDPQRVYAGGFSGGARVALRLALAYPDLFRGALLNAGSDPLDAGPPAPPPPALLAQFQAGSRLVFVTGEHDALHLRMDADATAALRRWCVFDYETEVTAGAAHQVADAGAFAGALHLLTQSAPTPAHRLQSCRAQLQRRIDAQLDEVATLIGAGKRTEAQAELTDLDRHLGGAALPRSLELEDRLGWEFAAPQ